MGVKLGRSHWGWGRAKRERAITWWNPSAQTRPLLDSSSFVLYPRFPAELAPILILAFSLFALVAMISHCLCSKSPYLSIKLYRIYVCYPWIRWHYCRWQSRSWLLREWLCNPSVYMLATIAVDDDVTTINQRHQLADPQDFHRPGTFSQDTQLAHTIPQCTAANCICHNNPVTLQQNFMERLI
jgi:hypothetical protein